MNTEPLVSIRDLRVEFPGILRTVKAVRGVDLDIARSDVMGIVGESGCGKSMTASAILGITPDSARVSGSIKVSGEEIIGRSETSLRALRGGQVAMIFQNPMKALNPFFPVGRQMTDVIRLHRNVDRSGAHRIALSAFEDVNMPDPGLSFNKYPHQMSGGQLQRVMIALALACDPQVLIADEPTTALDVTVQAQIVMLMRALASRRGMSVIFITHDLGLVASICNKVTVMYAGQVVETGPVKDIFTRPRHPYTVKLIDMIPIVGRGKAPLETIPGNVPDLAFPPAGCAFHNRCDHASKRCNRERPAFTRLPGDAGFACHHPASAVEEKRSDA